MLASGALPIGADMPRKWWAPNLQAPFTRLAIWIFWLLASMAVGGTIGAWLSDSGSANSVAGMIVGGFIYSCLSIWRNW